MTIRDELLLAIEQVPEPLLEEVLDFVRSLKGRHQDRMNIYKLDPTRTHEAGSPTSKTPSKAFQAFLASLEERKEVYRRLADS